jgi:hypothetical protein
LKSVRLNYKYIFADYEFKDFNKIKGETKIELDGKMTTKNIFTENENVNTIYPDTNFVYPKINSAEGCATTTASFLLLMLLPVIVYYFIF